MPQEDYVVKYNTATDLYLLVYAPNHRDCQWTGNPNNALIWDDLEDAETVASLINSGSIGMPKP